ncbi:cytochrome b-245 light chain-like isoform X2 [Tubulanus polymorphus]
MFRNWQIAAFSICASIVIFFVEYPRGKRKKGSSNERRFQHYLTVIINQCGPVTRNYYVRSIIHLVLCIPCFFLLPTLIGGLCLFITAALYMVAAIKGEKWIAITKKKKEAVYRLESLQPPSHPPPRRPKTDESTLQT